MKKSQNKYLLMLCNIFFYVSSYGQNWDEDESYNWSEFDGQQFFTSAIICAGIIGLGLVINKNSENSFLKGLGNVIIGIGSLGALGTLGSPILSAIEIIWQVLIGLAVFLGIIYFVYTEFIDK